MSKITSLHDFAGPPLADEVAVGLINDSVKYSDRVGPRTENTPLVRYFRGYFDATVTQDMLATREFRRTIGAGELFLPVQDSAFKKIASVWRERGFVEAVSVAASENPREITIPLHWIAVRLKTLFGLIEKVTSRAEGLPASGLGSVADVAATREWPTALVRCLAWHPHCTRLALATHDDRIRIFSNGAQVPAVLRHSAQKSVCCLSWRPNAGRELAAACRGGILVWTVELGAASSSLSHALFLTRRNHGPVTSVTWHPQGDLLVSCSSADSNMIVWDVSRETGVPLKRVGSGGLCFTRWSSCGSKLLAATSRKVFRVWNTGVGSAWGVERWTVPNGRVAAACFGPNLTLLFTSTEDPATVFSLPLQENIFDVKNSSNVDDMKIAIPLIDLTRVTFPSYDDETISVGGRVISMEWDPSGKYLAIIFQDSPMVAIFKTKVRATSRVAKVSPGCLVGGTYGEVPSCMHFHQNYNPKLEVACLTIAWSSGRVQHFPIVEEESADSYANSVMTSNSFRATNDFRSPVQ